MLLIRLLAYVIIGMFALLAVGALTLGIWLSFKLIPVALMAIGGITLVWVVLYAFDKLIETIKEVWKDEICG